ncbi:Protein C17F4.3 [Aphelenchoides avenae]|nr:Protein C17F4.3 [Aphelenchus avenae]
MTTNPETGYHRTFVNTNVSTTEHVSALLPSHPRGLGLLQLPTGVTDERSGPMMPNIYVAGNKPFNKPQTVPNIHLPGQFASFQGRSFNPFTQAVSAIYHEDLSDAWGVGYAVTPLNLHGLDVRGHFDGFADMPLGLNDRHQPFVNAFVVGGEYDLIKIREVAGHLNVPLPGINELFDLDGQLLVKNFGVSLTKATLDFPLTLSDPTERWRSNYRHIRYAADRAMHYGHVIPNVNPFLIKKKHIMRRLMRNRLNPTHVG